MQWTALFLLGFCLQVTANVRSQTVTFTGKNVPLETILNEVKAQTGYYVLWNKSIIRSAKPVDVTADRLPVEDFMNLIFRDQPLDFELKGNTIMVGKKKSVSKLSPAPVAFPIENIPPVTGRITDAEGNPVSGASVTIKGTKIGTTTDANGNFLLNVEPGQMLIISSVEFETKEYKINNETILDIKLIRSVSALDEVVINKGYYTEKQRLSTGNVSKVTANEISSQPVSNVFQALQGRMAGVEVIQGSGIPGSAMKIQIRGQNSLRTVTGTEVNGNLPLYIVDGVPVTSAPLSSNGALTVLIGIDPLNAISPANIESIEILKDADATSIYGSRGANGVVLITTKKGTSGKLTASVNVKSGFGIVSNQMKLLNTSQYLEMRNEAFANDNVEPNVNQDYDLLLWDTTRYTDWQKELFGRTANVTDAHISLTAGNVNTNFRFGGGFYKETTVFPGDFGYHRISGLLNLNHRSSDQRLNLSLTLNYGIDRNLLFSSTIVSEALRLPPNAPSLYDDAGNLNWENSTWTNPIGGTKNVQTNNSNNMVFNTSLGYKLLPGLNFRANIGYTTLFQNEKARAPKSSSPPDWQEWTPNQAAVILGNSRSWITEPQIHYITKISDGQLDVIFGSTWQSGVSELNSLYAYGFTSENLIDNMSAAQGVLVTRSENVQYKYNSAFGRLGFNWDEKYIVNFTMRRDGSSRFGPGKQFANFGSVGAAWIFSNESLIKENIGFLSLGKLRLSYGSTGSDQIADYGYLDTYMPTANSYQGIRGLRPTGLANPDFRWELNNKFEVAFETNWLDDRVHLAISWYRNKSSNQLVNYNLPAITGFSSVIANFPATVENKGWEFDAKSSLVHRQNFKWLLSSNLTIPRNKLLSFPNIKGSSYASRYVIGMPLNIVRLYSSSGVDPATGIYQIFDSNQDGNFSNEDKIITERLGRDFYGGVQNVITIRNFEIDFLIEFVKQNGINYLSNFGPPGFGPGLGGNQPALVIDRWQKEGDISATQKFSRDFTSYRSHGNASTSSLSIEDASFIRLRNIMIAYNMSTSLLAKIGITEIKIYGSAQNIFTWTSYSGLDPQSPGSLNLPVLKMFIAGIQINL